MLVLVLLLLVLVCCCPVAVAVAVVVVAGPMTVAFTPELANPVVAIPPACITGANCTIPASLVPMGLDATLETELSPDI